MPINDFLANFLINRIFNPFLHEQDSYDKVNFWAYNVHIICIKCISESINFY